MAIVVINQDEDFVKRGRYVTNIAYAYDGNGLVQTKTVTTRQQLGVTDTDTETWVKTYTWLNGLCTNESGYIRQ